MNKKKIPSAGPSITELEIELVNDAMKLGWYDNRNMHIDQFVDEFSSIIKKKYILPVNSCTAAIHLSLLVLDVSRGDEIIVPDITWVASASPILYCGAKPVFCDIDKKNWCIDPRSFEDSITKKTKAVIVVDLYGNMPDYSSIKSIAKKHNIVIIEDAAESLGAFLNEKPAGHFGDISVFSFNATKIAIAGQGGVFATDDENLYQKAKNLHHHGMAKYTDKTTFWSLELGFNYQWTNIQAALALAQIRRLDELVRQRRQIFKWYYNRLKDVPGIQLNSEEKNVRNTYWVVSAIISKNYDLKKENFINLFSKKNIDSRPFFYPVSSMPTFEKFVNKKTIKKKNPISYDISPYGISFPSAANLNEDQVNYVCDIFIKFLDLKN